MLFDTHCHPYYTKKKSQKEILERFFLGGKHRYLNCIGVDIESSQKSIEIAKEYSGAYACIGIHPVDALKYRNAQESTIFQLEKLYRENSQYIIAIGEAGLDYYWLESLAKEYNLTRQEIVQIQMDFFRAQIHLAKHLSLPLIIHNRESSEDIFQILQEEKFKNFVFHCYSENLDYAKKLLDFAPNCMLGFGGITTFKNAEEISDTVKNIPLKNILIETDSPYLTPMPLRGKEENEPSFVKYILSHIIDIRDEPPEEITKTIFENSIDFFNIKNKKT